MGKKRKHRDSSSERLLKILKRELRKRRRTSSSSSENVDVQSGSESNEFATYYPCQSSDIENDEVSLPIVPSVVEEMTTNDPRPSTSAVEPNEESDHLDGDILTLLGDAPKSDAPVGKDVHPDIATRLQDVLLNGLKKDSKDKIIDEYPIPGNCQLFKAPILNPEVKAAISDNLNKKDASLAARQSQIGVALSALTSAMDILVNEKSDTNQAALKHICNAARLISDSHYIDTKLRRNFLISTLNNKIKDTLKESKRDKNLFGESLSEKLKATKAINKSSQDLKSYVVKPRPPAKNSRPANATNHLNWKHPQSNHQNVNQKTPTLQRTAGSSSAAHRNETIRRPQTSRVKRDNTHYKNQRRY